MIVTLGHFATRLNERVLHDVVAVRVQRAATIIEFDNGTQEVALFWDNTLDGDDIPFTYDGVTYETLAIGEVTHA